MERTHAAMEDAGQHANRPLPADRDRWTVVATAIGLMPAETSTFVEMCIAGDAARLQDYLFMRLVGVDNRIEQLERRRDALLALMHSFPAVNDVAESGRAAESDERASGSE